MKCNTGQYQRCCPRSGFSFVELIVILAIITLLMGLLLPALGKAREAARATQCKNNLRNIALGIIHFHDTYNRLPASGNYGHDAAMKSHRHHSWAVSILPFIDQKNLFDQLNLDMPINDPANAAIKTAQVPLYLCPIDITRNKKDKVGDLSYAVNGGVGFTTNHGGIRDCPSDTRLRPIDFNGDGSACSGNKQLDDRDRKLFKYMGLFFLETWNTEITKRHYRLGDIRDGASNTLMVAENIRTGFAPGDPYGHFGDPTPHKSCFFIRPPCAGNSCTDGSVDYSTSNSGNFKINSGLWAAEGKSPVPNSFHQGGVHVAFADGRVQYLSEEIDGTVYGAISSPAGMSLDSTPLQQTIPSDSDY